MSKKANHTPLNPIITQELKTLGEYLHLLRKRQKMTLEDMCMRIGANPRTVSKIEKGDPTVSLGTFIAYLNILSLARGVSERILGDYLLAIKEVKRKNVFTDEEMGY